MTVTSGLGPQHRFSDGERDRRWAAVRALMRDRAIECVVTAPNARDDGRLQGDCRYLSGTSGDDAAACIFPVSGRVSLVGREATRQAPAATWVADVRPPEPSAGEAVAAALAHLPSSLHRVGVTGLQEDRRDPGGAAPHGFMSTLQAALPSIEWVDVTDGLRGVRAVKSEEEVRIVETAVAILESAIERAETVARPRAAELDVWAAVVGELLARGSAPPTRSSWGTGLRPIEVARPPHGVLQRGSIVLAEVEAAVGGYRACAMQPIAVEDCDAALRDLYALLPEYWQACLEAFGSGGTLGEIAARCAEAVSRLAARSGRYRGLRGGFVLDGCGLGHDDPFFSSAEAEASQTAQRVEEGWVFTLRPSLRIEPNNRPPLTATWSDVVAVGPQGPRRLGRRPVGILVARSA